MLECVGLSVLLTTVIALAICFTLLVKHQFDKRLMEAKAEEDRKTDEYRLTYTSHMLHDLEQGLLKWTERLKNA